MDLNKREMKTTPPKPTTTGDVYMSESPTGKNASTTFHALNGEECEPEKAAYSCYTETDDNGNLVYSKILYSENRLTAKI